MAMTPNKKIAPGSRVTYGRLLKAYSKIPTAQEPARPTAPRQSFDEELERERRHLQNADLAQDIKLKKKTLNLLFWFLGLETVAIFTFALLQATHWLGFSMEEWSFKLLISATIAQITAMLFVAVSYLFPKPKK